MIDGRSNELRKYATTMTYCFIRKSLQMLSCQKQVCICEFRQEHCCKSLTKDRLNYQAIHLPAVTHHNLIISQCNKWLKSRCLKKAKQEYINTEHEMKRDREIEEMFLLFDKNRSGTLELNEIAGMFRENGIKISLKIIRRMFGLIDNDSSGSITFSEFKDFLINKQKQEKFKKMMKTSNRMNYLPSSAESMIRYLKSIAVRNSIYKDLHVKGENMEKAEPIFVYLLLRSKEKRRGQCLPDNKKSESDYLNRCQNEVTNFVDIFSEYPVGFEISNNPIQELCKKKELVHRVINVPTQESIEAKEPRIRIKKSRLRKVKKNTYMRISQDMNKTVL